MNKEVVEQFLPLFEQLKEIAILTTTRIKPQAESVIAGRITDEDIIAHMFDDMISNGHSEEMTQLFKRVCRAIYDTHTELVNFYVKAYLEMWDDADDGESNEV